MKKYLSLAMVLVLSLSFCACGNIDYSSPNPNNLDPTTSAETAVQETTIPNNGEWDEILCSGDDYHLVKKTIDTFEEYKLMLGVVNSDGEWVQELTDKGEFVDMVIFRSLGSSNTLSDSSCFAYLGEGVFLASPGTTVVRRNGSEYRIGPWDNSYYINECNNEEKAIWECLIWNVVDNIQTRFDSEKISVFQDGYVFFAHEYKNIICIMNKKGEITELPCRLGGFTPDVPIYSEGLFYARTENGDPAFFDINGNLIIDLSKYNIYNYDLPYFKNGETTIFTQNNGGSRYKVTIDKTGAIIGEPEKID